MFALADCNNFFVSCERVFRPELNGRPVIVLSNNDGCAVSRSNEAKALGIKMGAPLFEIRELVEKHGVAVFSSNYALYGDMSRRVQEVLRCYSPAVEQYSIDEAFLDLRGMTQPDPDALAKEISSECRHRTAIPVSVGIAPTKTLAKIASKLCKQYPRLRGGCYMHKQEDIEKVLRRLPVADVWGIGRRNARKLEAAGIKSAWDFTRLPEMVVRKRFALPGLHTWKELQGIPCIEFEDMVEPRQSICVSRSFAKEITDPAVLSEQVANFAEGAVEKLRAQHSLAFEIAVFAMTNRFKEGVPQTIGSSLRTFPDGTSEHRTIVTAAVEATRELFRQGYGYKKAGVVITRLCQESGHTPSLFADTDAQMRESSLSQAIDQINGNFGRGAILFGVQGDGHIRMSREHQSPHYTTLWSDIPTASVK